MLDDSESDHDESLHQLTINEHYAKAFEYKKEREELQRLKEQYGSDPDTSEEESTDSEDLESEDSDGEELTPAMDAAILRTLARIKRKDPKIYETGHNVFDEEQEKTSKSAETALRRPEGQPKAPKDKSKPLTIRALNLQSALLSRSASPVPEEVPVTHDEEQQRLRNETIAAFHAVEPDDDDDLLVPREKNMDELAREEEEYRLFLEREVGDLRDLVDVAGEDVAVAAESPEDASTSKKKKKKGREEKGGDGEADAARHTKREEDQEFLVNYILNRGWIDRTSKRVPTYGEVTSQSKKKGKSKAEPTEEADGDARADAEHGDDDDDDEEEVFDDIVDRFESSYNFRFEEPDGTEIKTYPRNLPSLVRREDTTRKEARERRKQRKEAELAVRKEEVRRLKGLKMKEIRARLERAGVATGEAESLKDLGIDLDAPWDPEAHDRQMAGLYALDGEEDVDEGELAEKPTWEDDVNIGDIVPEASTSKAEKKKEKKKKKKKGAEEDEAGVDIDAMDADAVPAYDDEEEWDGTEEMRKRKLNEWMDELYALDFNDLVGGMPTRFQYTSVPSQNFGLSAVDILLAKDTELNEYMSVKKYAPYRADNRAGWDKGRGERLKELKGKVRERAGAVGDESQTQGREGQKKKRKGKKERMKEKGAGVNEDGTETVEGAPEVDGAGVGDLKRKRDTDESGDPPEGGKKKRRRKKKDVVEVDT